MPEGNQPAHSHLWIRLSSRGQEWTTPEIESHSLGDKYGNNKGYFGIPLAVISEGNMANANWV
jgi:hypothetical protein